jgi:hypothetical protein
MPCPQPLAPRKCIDRKPNNLFPSFFASRERPKGIHPLQKTNRPQKDPRDNHLTSKEVSYISGRAATAARNCTSYRRPPAGAFAFDLPTTSERGFIPSEKGPMQFPSYCAASPAQHALRAQAHRSTRPMRAAAQLATDLPVLRREGR